MFGGPLRDALSLGGLCSVYKAGCCRSSGLGKKQVSLRHETTKATQQVPLTIFFYARLIVEIMSPILSSYNGQLMISAP